MKKSLSIFTLLLGLVVTLGVARFITPSALENNAKYTVTASYLNVRSGPGTEYSVIGAIKYGSEIQPIETVNGWYKISFNNAQGYVSGQWVAINNIANTALQTSPAPAAQTNIELEIFNLVNARRKAIGVKELVWDNTLYSVASIRATEIISYWSHLRPNGTYPDTAFTECGVKYSFGGENLARGGSDASAIYNGWLNSPSHKQAMENNAFGRGAISVKYDSSGKIHVALELAD